MIRWLAIALLLFAQFSLASHYHPVNDIQQHDCSLCSQLQSVSPPLAQTSNLSFPSGAQQRPFRRITLSVPASRVYVPPSRAPPRI